MTTFIEKQFPSNISIGATGGPRFSTDIVSVSSGYEKRNINWEKARAEYEVSHAVRTPEEYATLLAFFKMVRGRAIGFRFKDWLDFKCATSDGGVLAIGSDGIVSEYVDPSTLAFKELGYKTYQLTKIYKYTGVTSDYYLRYIKKPVAASVIINRNGTPIGTHLSTATYINNIDYTTGIVTFNPQYTFTISAITKGTTTSVVVSGDQTANISVNDRLLFGDCSNNGITALTNTYHTVQSRSYSAPNTTIVLTTNTSSYTGNWIGTESLYKFAQGNTLTMSCEFDVPARFDIDYMQGSYDNNLSTSWSSIPIIEIKSF